VRVGEHRNHGGALRVLASAPQWWPAGRRWHQASSGQEGTWPSKSSPSSTAMIAMLADTLRLKTSSASWRLHAWSFYDCELPTGLFRAQLPAARANMAGAALGDPHKQNRGIIRKTDALSGRADLVFGRQRPREGPGAVRTGGRVPLRDAARRRVAARGTRGEGEGGPDVGPGRDSGSRGAHRAGRGGQLGAMRAAAHD
jgi:hypothetical protein